MRKPRNRSKATRKALNKEHGIPLTHTDYQRLSVRRGRRGGGGGDGWRVEWLVDMSKAVPRRTYYLYQNIRTSMRELDADGNVIDHEVYSFCEVWKFRSNGVNMLKASDAFEDVFLIPFDWRINAGRMVVRSQCWIESNAPGPSFRRNTKRGLWGTVPSPGARVMERRFRAAWRGDGPREGGEDIELRVASIGLWNGRTL
eukprot:CAMPEP_0119482692 /NCGR_PEP_ID=MMETSP1344-20130328/10436_1 /TAXON_ID=236787 /ORGANISM="Florenciella parvula, Strain CCMP2471" /LENGTH=199 /DNA_ID=CAMNT_0007517123 /DNA_START=215 /DNA_END=814 /DNA_ORIENTATION=-